MIPFAEFTPDLPVYGTIENALPITSTSYGPVKQFTTIGGVLGSRCQGACAFRAPDGSIGDFAGDSTKLWRWNGTVWNDVSRLAGGAYATPPEGFWSFAQFGDIVVAANGIDAPQSISISGLGNFSALAGSPPIANFAATVRDFMVLGRLAGQENSIRWSAINNVTSWTIGVNQADTQLFPEGGRVMGLVGGQYMIVFLETAIQRGTYVGPDLIFQFDAISRERGCVATGSISSFENLTFFLSSDGFFLIDLAGSMTPIGDQKLDRWFWENVRPDFLHRISSTIDPKAKLYYVSFPSILSVDGTPDTILVYNWTIGRWSRITQTLDVFVPIKPNLGYTLEDLDSLYGALDSIPFSLDSFIFKGSSTGDIAGFGTDFKLGFFSGAAMESKLETQEMMLTPNRRSIVKWARPFVDGGDLFVSLGSRNLPNEAASFGAETQTNSIGRAPMRSDAVYHRARVRIASGGDWVHAQGVELEYAPTSWR